MISECCAATASCTSDLPHMIYVYIYEISDGRVAGLAAVGVAVVHEECFQFHSFECQQLCRWHRLRGPFQARSGDTLVCVAGCCRACCDLPRIDYKCVVFKRFVCGSGVPCLMFD